MLNIKKIILRVVETYNSQLFFCRNIKYIGNSQLLYKTGETGKLRIRHIRVQR